MYPLKKDFFKNEINKLKYIKNYQIYHPEISNNKLVQQVTKKVLITKSDNLSFNHMIDSDQLDLNFI